MNMNEITAVKINPQPGDIFIVSVHPGMNPQDIDWLYKNLGKMLQGRLVQLIIIRHQLTIESITPENAKHLGEALLKMAGEKQTATPTDQKQP